MKIGKLIVSLIQYISFQFSSLIISSIFDQLDIDYLGFKRVGSCTLKATKHNKK